MSKAIKDLIDKHNYNFSVHNNGEQILVCTPEKMINPVLPAHQIAFTVEDNLLKITLLNSDIFDSVENLERYAVKYYLLFNIFKLDPSSTSISPLCFPAT